jgi:hypothetical protein
MLQRMHAHGVLNPRDFHTNGVALPVADNNTTGLAMHSDSHSQLRAFQTMQFRLVESRWDERVGARGVRENGQRGCPGSAAHAAGSPSRHADPGGVARQARDRKSKPLPGAHRAPDAGGDQAKPRARQSEVRL